MRRFKLTIEYDGTPFVGWQFQSNGLSIQGVIEEALFKLTQETIRIEGSGRTDAGVHAQGQVAHFDLSKNLSPCNIRQGLNFYLHPHPIIILKCEEVALDFHARFSARRRTYRYRILNRRSPPALDQQRVWWISAPLNLLEMQKAAEHFIGKHDFTTFRAKECQALSPLRTVNRLTLSQQEEEIWIDVQAKSFLHHQVRIMVGTLKKVGEGQWKSQDIPLALAARCRRQGGPTAPAYGLYFQSVEYNI